MRKFFAIILSLGFILTPLPRINTAHASGAMYAQQILGMSNGIIGGAILTKCAAGYMQPSLYLYMAGSLIYVAAEVIGAKQKQKRLDQMSERLDSLKASEGNLPGAEEASQNFSNSLNGDYQMMAIDAQAEDAKSELEFIKGRRKWMLAVKTVYTAAFAMAIIEQWLEVPPPVGLGKPSAAACSPAVPSERLLVQAVIMAYSSLQMAGGNVTLGGMAKGMAMQMAMKKFGPMILGGTEAVNATGVPLINTAAGRIVFFGAAAALVWYIDADLAKQEREAEKNHANIVKVQEEFKKNSADTKKVAEGSTTTGGGDGQDPKRPQDRKYDLKALPEGKALARMCFSKDGGSINFSSGGCSNPLKLSKPTMDANFDIPTLQAVANLATDGANGLANGNIAGAEVAAGSLGAMAGKMDKLKDQLVKKANDRLKAEGKKPIDIDGELKRQLAVANDAFNKASPGSGGMSLGSLQGGAAAASPTTSLAEEKTPSAINGAAAPAAVALPESGAGIDVGALDDGSDPAPEEKVATLEEKLGEYELDVNDVSTKSDVSIFKQVSNRYFLNYTKLFERKSLPAPEVTDTPK